MSHELHRPAGNAEAEECAPGLAQGTLDALPDPIGVLDGQGVVVAANRAWLQEATAGGVAFGGDYLAGCDASLASVLREVLEGRASTGSLEFQHLGRWSLARITCFGAGSHRRVVVSLLDVSARVLSEETLRSRERSLAAATEGSSDGLFDIDIVNDLAAQSPRYWEVVGWPAGTAAATPLGSLELIHPEERPQVTRSLARAQAGETDRIDEEYRQRTSDGGWKWLRTRLKVLARTSEGQPARIAGAVTDVEERRQRQEAALREARLRGLSGRMNEAELVSELSGTIVEANDRALELYGHQRADLTGRDLRTLFAPAGPADVLPPSMVAAEGARFEAEHLRRDGTRFPVEVSARPFQVGGVTYLHSLVRDLTEPRRVERERLELQRRLADALKEREVILENASVGLSLVKHRRQSWANHRLADLLGCTAVELAGSSTVDLHPTPAAWERLENEAAPVLRRGRVYATETQLRRKDGTMFWARLQGRAVEPSAPEVGTIWCFEDITVLKQLGARATQAERLAATGTLARGMAHEINNPLSAVLSNLSFAREQLPAIATPEVLMEVAEALVDAQAGAGSIREIVKDLQSFALGDLPSTAAERNLELGVRAARRLAGRELARCSSVAVEVPEVADLTIPHPDLVQLLAHLLTNAGQATDRRPNHVRIEATLREPAQLELCISDTGVGMPEDVLTRAFDPFFTTRPVGRGRGLGLSVCHGIVQSVGGQISLASKPGDGTTVTVTLPRRASARR
jgi:PAS domain S-box-containing protein